VTFCAAQPSSSPEWSGGVGIPRRSSKRGGDDQCAVRRCRFRIQPGGVTRMLFGAGTRGAGVLGQALPGRQAPRDRSADSGAGRHRSRSACPDHRGVHVRESVDRPRRHDRGEPPVTRSASSDARDVTRRQWGGPGRAPAGQGSGCGVLRVADGSAWRTWEVVVAVVMAAGSAGVAARADLVSGLAWRACRLGEG